MALEIKTAPATMQEVREQYNKFLENFLKDGKHLRMEFKTNLQGQRLVLVFDWGDQG